MKSALQLGNPAGIGWYLGEGLASHNWLSRVVELEPEGGDFPTDFRFHMTKTTPFPIRVLRFAKITRLARHVAIIHFHFGIRPFGRFLRRLCEAPFVVHFHGSDLREGMADAYRDLASAEFISTPDLARWAPRATWVPNPCGILDLVPRSPVGSVVVGHFPSDPKKKGTQKIIEAVRRVQETVNFDFRLVTGVSHEMALSEMRKCDVVIDQLSAYGVYGMVSVEAMGLGRTVLSSINTSYYENCPIIPISEDNFESRLSEIVSNLERRARLGKEGHEYVSRIHHPTRVAAIVAGEYAKIG